MALGLAMVAGLFNGIAPTQAFKPNTHIYTGYRVWDEVTQTGSVTITNASGSSHAYPVDARLVSALKNWPQFYNAGVIGPDGFPDIIYGQQIVHPDHTGQWLRYMYRQAWAAQSDPQYTPDQRAQILAFVYGYLTHAAGDMWGHTLINDFAGGVFPSVTKTFSDLGQGDTRRLLIALRHIVAEGYVGDATPGFDVFNSDDVPDPLKGCSPAQPVNSGQGGIDTQCNNDPTQIQEASVVCDPNAPPTRPGTTCTVPGQFNNPVPDVSLDSTPGVQLDAPIQWIQNVMISQGAPTPNNACIGAPATAGCPGGPYALGQGVDRGFAIDYFLDLEAKLQVATARFRFDAITHNCSITLSASCSNVQVTLDPIHTVRGIKSDEVMTISVCAPNTSPCTPDILDTGLIDGASADYLDAWIADIDVGLSHWSEFSLAIAKGFFDPQARRDAANDTCQGTGPETVDNLSRDICEKKVSHLDAAIWEADHIYPTGDPSFINRYLIPMLGAPDILGDIRNLSQLFTDALGAVFNFLGIQNPLTAIINALHELEVGLIEDQIKQSWGVDIRAWEQFGEHVSHWFCGLSGVFQPFTFDVPYGGPTITISATDLFSPNDHALMDLWLGLPTDHHSGSTADDSLTTNGVPVPKDCTALSDTAKFDANNFGAVKDTVMMAKLLLLDGAGLDHVLGDALHDQGVTISANSVKTYEPATAPTDGLPANIMFASLSNGSAGDDIEPFLQLIDGDHAWRQDGLPTFCQNYATFSGPGNCSTLPPELAAYTRQPAPRLNDETGALGGNGTFPMWKSCLLRPAFRGLFTDWENADNSKNAGGLTNFPDLGDVTGPDASAPKTASATSAATSNLYVDTRGTFVGPANVFTVTKSDEVFTPSQLAAQYRFYLQTGTPSTFLPVVAGTFSIPAASGDGLYNVDSRAQDPCHPFASLPASANSTTVVYLDTTPPKITINQPAATSYTHSQTLTLSYTVDDGLGSGVKSFTPTMDGLSALAGHGLQNGQLINLLTELPLGTHTFTIFAVDNVGNSTSVSVTFTIIVTANSIIDDVTLFQDSGDISKHGIANSLLAKLNAAADARSRGNCTAAGNIYGAFINEVRAQTGKGISALAASIMIADAQYLIANCP